MSILIIHPIYTIGTEYSSNLDVCFLNENNIFNEYAKQTKTHLNTIDVFKHYFHTKLFSYINPEPLINQYDMYKNIIHVFFKLLSEYKIKKVYIYNSHFFDILVSTIQVVPELQNKYNKTSIIVLFFNKYTWHEQYYEQYIELTCKYKYDIQIVESERDIQLYTSMDISYDKCSTDDFKYIYINCKIYPYLDSNFVLWEYTISKFINELYGIIPASQTKLNMELILNIYINLNTTQYTNLYYICNNIDSYISAENIYLKKYSVDFNTIDSVLLLFFIKLKLKTKSLEYNYNYTINYFLV